jgi:hypothetical protein
LWWPHDNHIQTLEFLINYSIFLTGCKLKFYSQ